MTPPPEPQKKSKVGLYIGGGCGCLLVLGCLVGGLFGFSAYSALSPGEEVVSTQVTLGQPYTVSYTQSGDQRYQLWMELDLEHDNGYQLNGTSLLSENGTAFGQYTINEDGNGSPVQERNSRLQMSWRTSSVNGRGSTAGTLSLFPIPARTDGGTVTISGTLTGTPGMTGTVRLFVAKRD